MKGLQRFFLRRFGHRAVAAKLGRDRVEFLLRRIDLGAYFLILALAVLLPEVFDTGLQFLHSSMHRILIKIIFSRGACGASSRSCDRRKGDHQRDDQ